jgi:hypothetical protein
MLLYRHFLNFNSATLSSADLGILPLFFSIPISDVFCDEFYLVANPRPPPMSRDMKTVLFDTCDIIEVATGWGHETIVLIRVLLSSLCMRIQSAPREFMSEPKHHAWNNMLDIMVRTRYRHTFDRCIIPCCLLSAQ